MFGAFAGQAAIAGDVARIEMYPPTIAIDGAEDRQRVIVRVVDSAGVTRDVSDVAQWSIAAPSVATMTQGVVRGVADGETILQVAAEGLSASIPVAVRGAGSAARPTSFRLDVLPALTGAGCNTGSCHGSSRGQDGFHLSLFGFDPASDYQALTREVPGRRLNLATPEASLMLQKPLGAVPHTGGQRFSTNDERYQTVLRWLREGAPDDAGMVASVAAVELFPPDMVLVPGATQRLIVRAKYSDGTDRDVTHLATIFSSNDFSAKPGDGGMLSALEPGEAQILARFGPLTVGVGAIVVPADAPSPGGEEPGGNYIDDAIGAKLRRMRIVASGLSDDSTFLRRVTLDLTGLLPTPAEFDRFMGDQGADKRARRIDELMARKEFTEIWVMKWAERLAVRSTPEVSTKATLLYATWLEQRIASGAPIDQIVRELIAAQGGTFDTPATNFFQLERDTLKLSENVAQAFLGTRLQCAQCHNHPFDRWTMDDYYGLAAFFTQIGRKPGEDPRETVVFDSATGEMKHPVGGGVVQPRFLGTAGAAVLIAGKDRRESLARWITSDENRMFARNIANFTWAHFFHRGIVDPVDDVRVSNPPSNDALLEALAGRTIAYKYDLRALVRDICNSHAYQRSTLAHPTNARDDRNYSRASLRRIRAEFLQDAISQVTLTKDKFDGLPLGARAVQIADGTSSTYFLTTFGRATRQTVCTCEVLMEPSLSQALHLINGDTVHEKIKRGGRIASELSAGRTPEEILVSLYISTLSRMPSESEKKALLEPIAGGAEAQPVLEDAFWALLNSREFMFNH